MGIFQGNIFGTGENPMVTASRGELFVPIGDEDHPPVARRIIIGFLAIVVVLSVILFANRLYRQSITLPERNGAIIGYSIDDITEIPDTITYAGVDFAYEVTDYEGIIDGCQYTARGNAEELAAVVERLLKRYGEPGEFDKIALSALTKEELATLDTATWSWDYGKRSVKALESLDSWGSNIAGYYINPTYLYMDLIVTSGSENEFNILIRYQVRPRY